MYNTAVSNFCALEKAMATLSSTLAWKIPWTEEPGRLQSMGSLRDMAEGLHFHFSLSCIGEGNGNPLQCSCLENPRDRGAWWATVYGVAQSWPRLKQLSSSSRVSYSFLVLNMINLRLKLSKCKVPTSPSYFHYPPLPRGDLELGQGCLTSHLLASLASFIPVVSLALAHPAWPAIC